MNWLQTHWTKMLWGLAGLVLLAYLWNAYRYNPWDSYDGGAHLDYAFRVGSGQGLPTPTENYLAWHEPGYYWILGTLSRAADLFSWPRPQLYKVWQGVSAIVLWSGALAAGILAWQVTRQRTVAWIIGFSTASLFCWSALARYVTNEGMFQVGVLWWLVWFLGWHMDKVSQWSWSRWTALAIGLGGLLLIKLTAVVVVAAVLVWMWLQHAPWRTKMQWTGVVVAIVAVLYAPWLYYKYTVYERTWTINNFETHTGQMPLRFFVSWDESVLTTPFWIAGRGSFASMVLASTFVDYDNIFSVYDRPASTDLVTGNGRRMAVERAMASVQLVRWSLGLVGIVIVGVLAALWFWVLGRLTTRIQLLLTVAASMTAALVYNVWRYPFLERGTLKAIFIAAAFPLAGIVAVAGWLHVLPHKPRVVQVSLWLYWLVWLGLSWRIGLLPL